MDYFNFYLSKIKEKNCKILLINPSLSSGFNKKYSHLKGYRPRQPIDLAYICAVLKKEFPCLLVDTAVLNWHYDETINFISQAKPEIIILTTTQLDRWQNPNLDISSVFKIINSTNNITTIICGTHGTVTPEYLFNNCKIDFVVRGEPEYTVLELLKEINTTKNFFNIAGLSFKTKGNIINNADRIFNYSLDEIPFPAYEDLQMELYRYTTNDLPPPFTLALSSRGCPYECIFCLKAMMPAKYRTRSAENMIAEILYLKENFKIKSIYYQDWEFLIQKDRIMKFCNLKILQNINLIWGCSSRLSSLNLELISTMKNAGCNLINVGFETGSQEILNQSKKNVTLEKMQQAINKCQEANLNIRLFGLINLPGENNKTIKESVDFLFANKVKVVNPNLPIPYPGTKLYNLLNKNLNWNEVYNYEGKVQTKLSPGTALLLFKIYSCQKEYGKLFFLNLKFIKKLFRKIFNKL